MTLPKRTETQMLAAAPVRIELAGETFDAAPLGFGAACLWLERATLLEGEMQAAFAPGDFAEGGAPATPAVAARMMRFMPHWLELIFDYLGLTQEERERLDAKLGLNLDQSVREVATAYFALAATANPTKAGRARTRTAREQS